MISLEPGGTVSKYNDVGSVKLLGEEIQSSWDTSIKVAPSRSWCEIGERKRYRCSPHSKSEIQSLGGEETAWKPQEESKR